MLTHSWGPHALGHACMLALGTHACLVSMHGCTGPMHTHLHWAPMCTHLHWAPMCWCATGMAAHECAPNKDLKQGFQCNGVADWWADGAATCMLLPPLQLMQQFQWPCTLSAGSNRPETQHEYQAQVVWCAHSKSERVITWITLNNPKTTLVDFKTLTAHDIGHLWHQRSWGRVWQHG